MKKKISRVKELYVDKDGVGRSAIPKFWLEILGWKKGDKIEIYADFEDDHICIKRIKE